MTEQEQRPAFAVEVGDDVVALEHADVAAEPFELLGHARCHQAHPRRVRRRLDLHELAEQRE